MLLLVLVSFVFSRIDLLDLEWYSIFGAFRKSVNAKSLESPV